MTCKVPGFFLIIKDTIRSVNVLSFLDQFLSIRLDDVTSSVHHLQHCHGHYYPHCTERREAPGRLSTAGHGAGAGLQVPVLLPLSAASPPRSAHLPALPRHNTDLPLFDDQASLAHILNMKLCVRDG